MSKYKVAAGGFMMAALLTGCSGGSHTNSATAMSKVSNTTKSQTVSAGASAVTTPSSTAVTHSPPNTPSSTVAPSSMPTAPARVSATSTSTPVKTSQASGQIGGLCGIYNGGHVRAYAQTSCAFAMAIKARMDQALANNEPLGSDDNYHFTVTSPSTHQSYPVSCMMGAHGYACSTPSGAGMSDIGE